MSSIDRHISSFSRVWTMISGEYDRTFQAKNFFMECVWWSRRILDYLLMVTLFSNVESLANGIWFVVLLKGDQLGIRVGDGIFNACHSSIMNCSVTLARGPLIRFPLCSTLLPHHCLFYQFALFSFPLALNYRSESFNQMKIVLALALIALCRVIDTLLANFQMHSVFSVLLKKKFVRMKCGYRASMDESSLG